MFLVLIYREAAFHTFTFTQIYITSKMTAFWMLIPNSHALGSPTKAQAGSCTRAKRLSTKNSTTYGWRCISMTKLAFRGFPLEMYLLKEICFFQGELYEMQRHPLPLPLPLTSRVSQQLLHD